LRLRSEGVRLAVSPAMWRAVRARAGSAPADVIPGLLGATIRAGGVPIRATPGGQAGLSGVDEGGSVTEASERCGLGPCPGVTVGRAILSEVRRLSAQIRRPDLLIALAAPPPPRDHELAIGIAGNGFAGQLTSESTHTD